MNRTTCKNCGGDEGIHHFETGQCPVGGREASTGHRQEWKWTTFESEDNKVEKLRKDVNELSRRVADLEAMIKGLRQGYHEVEAER